jgi:hypothetical protein
VIKRLTFAVLFVAITFAVAMPNVTSTPVRAAADFRIIDVKAHDGMLVVEVEHFKADGSFDYFENYIWQGREGLKRPRVVNDRGGLYLSDGALAPSVIEDGRKRYYRPDQRSWLRTNTPHMDQGSILRVVQQIHDQRKNWRNQDWPRGEKQGQSRLSEPPIRNSLRDTQGVDRLVTKFRRLRDTAYFRNEAGTLMAYAGPLPEVNPGLGLVEYGTVSTFYPDSSVESTSVDGDVSNDTTTDWSSIRDAATGTEATPSGTTARVAIRTHTVASDYIQYRRGYTLFDTSSLGDTDTIDSATYALVVTTKTDQLGGSGEIALVESAPASNTDLVTADYTTGVEIGTTKQAANLTIASITADSSTANTWTLNATGEGNISLTGITKFGVRVERDRADSEPTWASNERQRIIFATADEVLGGDKRPVLTVTHTTPASAAITGTIGDGATEQEVRDGAGTIIITLSGETWVAAGGTFDAVRDDIREGLDAAEAEAKGWNAEVRDKMGDAAVVRTSDTIVTITVPETKVRSYQIDANEVITVTVPAAAVAGTGALTATPTITITAGAESARLGGTGASFMRPADLVAGSKTFVITLTNTKWIPSGADFDEERRVIINNFVASLDDTNGWNARRSDFADGNVVRTSATVVTITLSASASYAIPLTETVTVTVPASAIGGGALTPTPRATFEVVPIFPTSGNRVSTAINLSSVTDVAYCSLAWETTTPTGTSLTFDTSIDGGSTYTTGHTNGSCPTGITVGGSLATITDFRIRANMTTTVSGNTPTVDTLAIVIDDTTGQEIYYELNTTPSATLTDRSSSGTHTGTMSFPTQVSGVAASTGVQRSTSAPLTVAQALGGPQVASAVTGSAIPSNLFNLTETGFAKLPGQGLVVAMSEAGDGLPLRFVWFIFLGFLVIGMGTIAMQATNNLMVAGVVMAAGLGFSMSIGSGLMPGWILFTYIPIAGALIMFRKGFNP